MPHEVSLAPRDSAVPPPRASGRCTKTKPSGGWSRMSHEESLAPGIGLCACSPRRGSTRPAGPGEDRERVCSTVSPLAASAACSPRRGSTRSAGPGEDRERVCATFSPCSTSAACSPRRGSTRSAGPGEDRERVCSTVSPRSTSAACSSRRGSTKPAGPGEKPIWVSIPTERGQSGQVCRRSGTGQVCRRSTSPLRAPRTDSYSSTLPLRAPRTDSCSSTLPLRAPRTDSCSSTMLSTSSPEERHPTVPPGRRRRGTTQRGHVRHATLRTVVSESHGPAGASTVAQHPQKSARASTPTARAEKPHADRSRTATSARLTDGDVWHSNTIELIEGVSRSRGGREDAAMVGCIISEYRVS